MSSAEIDAYLAQLHEPKRASLERLRSDILAVVPQAQQCISYAMPAFRVDGIVVAGFAAFTAHLSYLPHSGSVLAVLADELAGYQRTTGALRFPIDRPLPAPLVARLVTVRLAQSAS